VELDEFCREVLPASLGFARVLTADRGLAEDLVQDVLVKLCSRPDRLDAIANREAYVRRMLVNEYVSWGRKWSRISATARVPDTPTPDPSGAVDDRDLLRTSLAALPRRQRAVIVLRYFAGLGDDEIAEELSCSVSTVRSHISRGLAALRISEAVIEGAH
jgi:RNA polymerase sigma-70 factor (sigma-E family)